MKKSYIQTILANFAAMDTDNLRLFLKDEHSYQDTTKELFLNEIASIFEVHKNSGDTELIIYRGKCGGRTCENCGKQGYRFVGNHSRNYLDLLFEMKGEDITDIYSCAQFNTFEQIDDLGARTRIVISLDNQVAFDKTPEYWSTVYAATKAWSEIITTPPRQIDFDDLCYWVDKNAVAYSLTESYEAFDEEMKWSPFSNLYSELRDIRFYISNYMEEFKLANFQSKQIQTEQDLIDWIVKYEDIHAEASSNLKYCVVKERGNFRLFPKNPILLCDPIFDDTFSFFKFFQGHFDDIFLKYSTYIDEENSIFYNTGRSRIDGNANFSLKFHLAHRKAMEELGTDVPFYLNKRS